MARTGASSAAGARCFAVGPGRCVSASMPRAPVDHGVIRCRKNTQAK
ncbi:hypothetical protein OH687_30485 [Burkholderia anthina]|nr:hypothetical protein OH687_30485 [Burkholderia anthina]